jgi:hypothetical protein
MFRKYDRKAELTKQNVSQAVLFVRDLDRGILGRGSHGLQQYEMLRRGTDALVNGILRVRRLLKQKRAADGDGEPLHAQRQAYKQCWCGLGGTSKFSNPWAYVCVVLLATIRQMCKPPVAQIWIIRGRAHVCDEMSLQMHQLEPL